MGDVSLVNMSNSKFSHYCGSKKKNEVGFFGLRIYFFSNNFHPKTLNKYHKSLYKSHINHKIS